MIRYLEQLVRRLSHLTYSTRRSPSFSLFLLLYLCAIHTLSYSPICYYDNFYINFSTLLLCPFATHVFLCLFSILCGHTIMMIYRLYESVWCRFSHVPSRLFYVFSTFNRIFTGALGFKGFMI